MKRKQQQKQFFIYIFLLLILVIGLGYALLQTNLNITGIADIGSNTWDIHFANVQVSDGSVTATTPATINPNDNTKVNYAITLDKPGDYYEFTVDIVNAGTLPGVISVYSITGVDPIYSNVIENSLFYTTNNPVQVGDIINPGATKTVKVSTIFKKDISVSELPSNDFNLNLVLSITYIQGDERETTTDTIINQLKTDNSSCFTKYEGQVTDQVGQTVTASNVYFNKCASKRNIIFNNMCWQMIRTTETGGIKIIYNGDVVDGKCESTRGNHRGIVQSNYDNQTLSSSYLYGSSFTYDTTNNTFTLLDTKTATWSDSTYEDLLGMFTCKNTTGTCTTIYNVNGYSDNTTAYTAAYTIDDTNYAQIGTSSFNANYRSPAMVGYMFNKVYNYKTQTPSAIAYKYGSSFTYNTSTNTYTLSGTTQYLTTLSESNIDNTHYTCWNAEGTCNNISYVYYIRGSTGYYMEINEGKNITDLLYEMLYNDSVNRYNSSLKGIIDSWYKQNMINKTNMLENAIYCNARNIINYGGFNPEGGTTSSTLLFKNSNLINDLSCANITDQFAVSNNKAKLTYPISLAMKEELYTLTNNNSNTYYDTLTKSGSWWWGISPNDFFYYSASVTFVNTNGFVNSIGAVNGTGGIRFVVSLKSGATISKGDGSETDPWVIN